MTKHDHFVLLVQLGFSHTRVERMFGYNNLIEFLGEAMKVDPVSLPDDVVAAAKSFVAWKLNIETKPEWLKEFEENLASRVWVEQQNGLAMWWQNAEHLIDGATVPKSWHHFVTGRNRFVEMTKRDAEEFQKWAQEIPGWSSDNPPLIIHREDPNE